MDSRLFLETTIQIDRQISDRKTEIKNKISKFSIVSTSTYVKMEYKRRLIGDYVYLYHCIIDSENISDVFLRLKKLRTDYHARLASGSLSAFFNFFNDKQEETIQGPLGHGLLEKAQHYFKQAIELLWESFNTDINEIQNKTDCYNAKREPKLNGIKFDNSSIRCKKSERKCKIVEFFQSNLSSFKKIYKMLTEMENLDLEQEKIKKILEKAIKYPENMADRKNCWNCGDAIISVELPYNTILFTTNKKHFSPICQEIGKEIYNNNNL